MIAAIERFIRDTAPPVATRARGPGPVGARRAARGRRPRARARLDLAAPAQNICKAVGFCYFGLMEPSTTTGRKGSLANPEVREDVPGHVIPIIGASSTTSTTRRRSTSTGRPPENEFIGFRLKQGVYGQRQPDVQMIRVKLPWGGISPEQMDAFASAIEQFAPLKKGHITTRQNIQVHHVPLRDAAAYIRELSDVRPLQPRGLRQHRAQRDRRPVGGRLRRRALRHDALRRRVRALLRAPPHDAADAAQGQDRLRRRRRRRPRADRHPRHRVHRPRARRRQGLRAPRRRRHVDHAARRADAERVRDRRRRRVPEVGRGRLPHLRPPGLAARQPRPRPPEGAGRQGRHRRGAPDGRRGARGRLGRRARLLDRGPRVPLRRAGRRAGGAAHLRLAQRRRRRVRPLPRGQRRGAAPGGLLDRPGQGHPRRPRRRSSSAASRQIMREYCGGHARTTVHQNLVLRWVRDEAVYDVWQRLERARPRRRRRRPGQRRRLLPRHRLLQARHHELDGAQPGGPGADRVDGHHRPADAQDPHQDVRLPERLQPAPHRQHRVLRRLDQGRRAHDPRLRRPHRRQLRGRRDRLRRSG